MIDTQRTLEERILAWLRAWHTERSVGADVFWLASDMGASMPELEAALANLAALGLVRRVRGCVTGGPRDVALVDALGAGVAP